MARISPISSSSPCPADRGSPRPDSKICGGAPAGRGARLGDRRRVTPTSMSRCAARATPASSSMSRSSTSLAHRPRVALGKLPPLAPRGLRVHTPARSGSPETLAACVVRRRGRARSARQHLPARGATAHRAYAQTTTSSASVARRWENKPRRRDRWPSAGSSPRSAAPRPRPCGEDAFGKHAQLFRMALRSDEPLHARARRAVGLALLDLRASCSCSHSSPARQNGADRAVDLESCSARGPSAPSRRPGPR